MKLLFKQKFFSWFDSYDIFDESGNTVYKVKGELAWGHLLRIYNREGYPIAHLKEKVLTWLPRFEMFLGENYIGSIKKEFTLLRPKYTIDLNGWQVEGDWFEWDYTIFDSNGMRVATISKELWNWTDTYVLDICNPADALQVLMLVLAIDAEKCSRDNNT